MSERYPMTQEAYNRRREEIEHLENVEMPKIAEKIAAAREEGDLKENAEYHGQREAQGLLQAKINELKFRLANAIIVDPAHVPKDEVAFGATVKVRDLDSGEEQEITLVGDGDEDYDNGKYLVTSPLCQGMLGKKVGEQTSIEVPRGTIRYEILEIRYEDM